MTRHSRIHLTLLACALTAGPLLAGCSGKEASAPQTGMALPAVTTETPHTHKESEEVFARVQETAATDGLFSFRDPSLEYAPRVETTVRVSNSASGDANRWLESHAELESSVTSDTIRTRVSEYRVSGKGSDSAATETNSYFALEGNTITAYVAQSDRWASDPAQWQTSSVAWDDVEIVSGQVFTLSEIEGIIATLDDVAVSRADDSPYAPGWYRPYIIVGFIPADQLRDSLDAGGDIDGYAKVTILADPSSYQIFNLVLEFSCVITSDGEPIPASDGGPATVEVSVTLERQYLPSAFELPDELVEES